MHIGRYFAGAFGHTYGHSAVMQMHKPNNPSPSYGVREYWTKAINATGASQMKFLKDLMLSKSFFDRIPDQTLIATNHGELYDYQIATRGNNYAFIYTYNGREIQVVMGKIEGTEVTSSWYNPRNGQTLLIGEFENGGTRIFNPPGEIQDGNDWVLVLESVK